MNRPNVKKDEERERKDIQQTRTYRSWSIFDLEIL